ncbi:putative methyltransferase [Frankia casuarinae]|uniref:16S rRNA (cytidine(1402)-2'-O)-methyltransferase n=1 Tax=Frankia TaxID=1854 RepID=UPI0003D03FBF|nr:MULTISPECIES: 16S rRNA (cytidine(1402)-2'-O)-methyltransferase [Frankia]ESZ99851.1 putative methyltransferase [Frankia sp. CcI6]EYT91023.1 putative methyltransferase [Frankia casuarinae]KEZ37032.1 putative S-adenosylmethionine-dependent methyltransferase, YraL family [Frankia sp. CeD]KFB02584.1 putative methyltransferase [Frankia sp. Allo2]OAA18313.1 16S rRNA (cytidine1402-2'-O)-methyltransferase [Frankia casuarinae]
MPGTLYLVPVPIGDPGDITARAVDVLRQVPVVAAEDTRNARRLLQPLGTSPRLLSYHDHNEQERGPQLLSLLQEGADVAVMSDAGTPLVNDPGYRLVAAAIEAGIPVRPLPGASAPVTALVGSGLPVHRFHFLGFLPRRPAARRAALEQVRGLDASLVLFEAPHRMTECLADLTAVLGERRAALARNLTKPDEQFIRGTLDEVRAVLAGEQPVRGQFTVVVEGAGTRAAAGETELADRVAEAMLRHGAGARLAREVVREVTGLPRNQVYALVGEAEGRVRSGTCPPAGGPAD